LVKHFLVIRTLWYPLRSHSQIISSLFFMFVLSGLILMLASLATAQCPRGYHGTDCSCTSNIQDIPALVESAGICSGRSLVITGDVSLADGTHWKIGGDHIVVTGSLVGPASSDLSFDVDLLNTSNSGSLVVQNSIYFAGKIEAVVLQWDRDQELIQTSVPLLAFGSRPTAMLPWGSNYPILYGAQFHAMLTLKKHRRRSRMLGNWR
jgi:hypothetical protein